MINSINATLDVALKALSLLFTICLFIGTTVIWSYLNKVGLGSEISSVISSPQVIFTIALYSIVGSVWVIMIFVLVPASIQFCEENPELEWQNTAQQNKFSFHFKLIFILLASLILAVVRELRGYSAVFFWLFVCLLMTSFFYKRHGGSSISSNNKLKNFSVVYVALTLAYGALICSVMFFLKVPQYLGQNEDLQWLIFFVILFLYIVAAAFASSSSDYLTYTPVLALALVVLLVIFDDTVSTNLASRLGVGNYSTSYAVEAKNLVAIRKNKSFNIEDTEDKDVFVLKEVWVVAVLPSKLILSPAKNNSSRYSMPIAAVLGEIN